MGAISHYIPVGLPRELIWALLFLILLGQLIIYTFICMVRDFRDHW
jgi:hypothetical protein